MNDDERGPVIWLAGLLGFLAVWALVSLALAILP